MWSREYVLLKGGEHMTEKKFSAIVTMKDGEKYFAEEVTKNGEDITITGQYKDGRQWQVETTKDQVVSIKRDIPASM